MSSDSGSSETGSAVNEDASASRPVQGADHREEVVLPDPDLPRSATSWPRPMRRLTSRDGVDGSAGHRVVAREAARLDHRGAADRRGPCARCDGGMRMSRSLPAIAVVRGAVAVWPDARCGLCSSAEPDAPLEAQGFNVGTRQLQPPDPIEDGVLLGDDVVVALLGDGAPSQRLRARSPVANRDGAAHLLAHQRVVGDDHDRHAQLVVHGSQQVEDLVGRGRVELAGGFVGEEHGWLVGERHGDRDALLLAAGEARPARCSPRSASPTRASRSLARAGAPAVRTPLSSIGSSTFWRALRYGSRFRAVCCQTKPTTRRRYSVRSRRPMSPRTWPATTARPADGTSSPPRMFMRVLLPLPEAPTSAMNSPGSTSRSSPWSATTSRSATL